MGFGGCFGMCWLFGSGVPSAAWFSSVSRPTREASSRAVRCLPGVRLSNKGGLGGQSRLGKGAVNFCLFPFWFVSFLFVYYFFCLFFVVFVAFCVFSGCD